MAIRSLICTTFLYILPFDEAAVTISFSPASPLILSRHETQSGTGQQPLAITCNFPPSENIVIDMHLYKIDAQGLRTRLMYAVQSIGTETNTQGLPVLDNATDAHVSGGISQRAITLTYPQASCEHGGTYRCKASKRSANFRVTDDEYTSNYSVTVGPGTATVTISSEGNPSGRVVYMFGKVVVLNCTVEVGTVVPALTKVDFVWQYKDADSSQPFQQYSNLNDIDNSEAPSPTTYRMCQTERRTSKLRRLLTTEDSARQYKCYLQKDNQAYEDLADLIKIDQINSTDNAINPPGNPGMTTQDIAIAAAVGGLVLLASLVVIVVARCRASQPEGNRRQSNVIFMAAAAPDDYEIEPSEATSDYSSAYTM